MFWTDIRKAHPGQWVVIEAIDADTTADNQRLLKDISVIDTCPDGSSAMRAYRLLHKKHPRREFYFAHTNREGLDIRVKKWIGVRRL